MGNRIVLLASAVMTAMALGATSVSAAPAADECLAKPKGPAPAGQHWYYRTNREIKRKCWYLADAGEPIVASAQKKPAAAPQPSASRDVDRSKPEADPQPQPADARAELVDEPQAAPAVTNATTPQADASQRVADESSQRLPEAAAPGNWSVASRWPESTESFTAARAPVVNDPAPAQRVEVPATVAAPAQQPAAAVAESSSDLDIAPYAAALLVIVVVGGTIFMFVSPQRPNRYARSARRTIDVAQRHEMPWARAAATRPAVASRAQTRRLDDDIEEVEQMLANTRRVRAG